MVHNVSKASAESERLRWVRNNLKARQLLRRMRQDWEKLTLIMEDGMFFSKTRARSLLTIMEEESLIESCDDNFQPHQFGRKLYRLTPKGVVFKQRCFD